MKTSNSYKNKLKALLDGLEIQDVEEIMNTAKTEDYRTFGKLYADACKEKIVELEMYKSIASLGRTKTTLV